MKVLDQQHQDTTDLPEAETLTAEALIREARQRQRRRWVIVISAVSVVLGAAVAVANGISGSGRTRSQTAPPLLTPAAILAQARSGIEGTYSATYRLSGQLGGPSSSAKTDGEVTVAKRAPAGSTAWPDNKTGEWSYLLTNGNGSTVKWVVKDNSVEDCMREGISSWRCSVGRNDEFVGGIGYELATIPFLPGTAFQSIVSALEGTPPRGSVSIRSEPSRLGPLTCLVLSHSAEICLLGNGHLASYTDEDYVGYEWTAVQVVSESPTAPPADFALSGVPKGPFVLPTDG